MQKDVPLRAGNVNVIHDIPKVNLTAGDFRKEYLNTFTNMAKDIYAIGNQFIAVDQKIEQNKEFNNVNNQLTEARAEYAREYEDPEKIKLGDSEWREQRDSALKLLREKEFEIIRSSRIDNISKEKFSTTSNRYYTEKGVKNNMIYGEYTRQTNLSEATNNITNSIELISMTDNESEREQLVNSVNNSRDILLKYGLPEAQVNNTILENIKKSLTIASKNDIDMLFDSNPPDVAYQKANELLGAGAQKYTALLGNVDGIKESKALDLMDGYYEEQKKTFGMYIKNSRDKAIHNLEVKQMMRERKKEAAIKKAQNIENNIKKFVDSGDNFRLTELRTGKVYTTEEMLDDNYNLYINYGYDLRDAGNPNSSVTLNVISEGMIKNIRGKFSTIKANNGKSRDIAELFYKEAETISGGDENKRVAILKNLGSEFKEVPTAVLLKGKENEDYFRILDTLKAGKDSQVDISQFKKIGHFTKKAGKEEKAYLRMLEELGGVSSIPAKRALDQYIIGKIKLSQDFQANEILKINKTLAVQNYIENNPEIIDEFEKDKNIIKELDVSVSTKYRPIKLNPNYEKFGIKPSNIERIQINKDEQEDDEMEVVDIE